MDYQLAVHLKEGVPARAPSLKNTISAAGGLKHKSKRDAVKAARAIVQHSGVEWVNISRVICESVARVSKKEG